jgi:hypothetical protein
MQKQILALLASLGLMAASALAANNSMVGKWKFDPNKSQLTGLQYKIEDAGGGKYRFAFGDDVETLTLDGKGHLTKFGDTWAIKATGPNSWESTTMRDGKLTARSMWTISKDGKTFTSIDENMRPDGSTGRTKAIFRRTGGTSGLAGTWESSSVKIMSPTAMEIAPWQGDGYSMINPVFKQRLDFKLDGKNYTPTGPRVAKGTTVTSRKTGDHNIQMTYKLKGKTTETDNWALSATGKTLTETINYPGVSKPEIDVFNRE